MEYGREWIKPLYAIAEYQVYRVTELYMKIYKKTKQPQEGLTYNATISDVPKGTSPRRATTCRYPGDVISVR